MISAADWAFVTGLLRETGRTEVMPRFRRLGPGAVRTKAGPADLVTDADVAAEAVITAGLRYRFPGCLIVGEEAAAENPALLQQLAGAALAFVVDPIDGTGNFVAGLPLFGIMAAAVMAGRTVAAAIHDPVGDDTAMALSGQGAWTLASDGGRSPLHVSQAQAPAAMNGCVSWRYMAPDVQASVLRNLPNLGVSADYRCSAHQYRMLAGGHIDYLVFNRLLPWDHLPGVLLHQEAGGYAAHFDASRYIPGQVDGGLICAPDMASYAAIRRTLLG